MSELHLESLPNSVKNGEELRNLKAVSNDSKLMGISNISEVMVALSNLSSTYDDIYLDEKRLATKVSESGYKYKLDEDNAPMFTSQLGTQLTNFVYRLEKTNVLNGEYSLHLKIGNEEEKPVLDSKGQLFTAIRSEDIFNKMKKIATNMDEFNPVPEKIDPYILKAVVISNLADKIPLYVVQGKNIQNGDLVADDFTINFSSNPRHTVQVLAPYYNAPKEELGSEDFKNAIGKVVAASEGLKAEDVLDFLSEKLKEQKDNSNELSGFKSRKFK